MPLYNKQTPTALRRGILSFLAFATPYFLMAQATGGNLAGSLTSVKDWIVSLVNVIFVIVMVVGVIKVVGAFIQGNPNATRNLVYLIVAALVWFGFSVLVGDFSSLGAIEDI
ncbi:MAG: hypothetical protein AAFN10_08555 [Bacteroidota bacterium]